MGLAGFEGPSGVCRPPGHLLQAAAKLTPLSLLQATSSALVSSSHPRASWSTQALWGWRSSSGSWVGA
jgi:hypothetical protein